MTDLISGQVQMMFTSMPTVLAHVKAGRLRLLGTGGKKRSAVIADTPPIADSVPGFELVTWYGIFVPTGTPGAIITRLNQEIGKVLADPESRDRMASQGLEPTPMSPEELRRYTEEESKRWTRLIKAAGIRGSVQ
jgi:tripartite-type tricarboxylate transporter receptor subunit TctC